MHRIHYEQTLPVELEKCWEFFSNPANLERIIPPDLNFELTSGGKENMYSGQIITYKIRLFPFVKVNWVTEITHMENREYFIDEQRFGPYKFWHHLHRFEKTDDGVKIEDIVYYKIPFGIFGKLVHLLFVKKRLKNIFHYRSRMINNLSFKSF